MPKRSLSLLLVVLLFVAGCHVRKVQQVPVAQIGQPGSDIISGLTLQSGEQVTFDPPGATLTEGVIHGKVKKVAYDKPISDVQRVWVEHDGISVGRTIGLSAAIFVGSLILLGGIVAATRNSCPFVYSWDGEKFRFDAEPYGGAIARGLEKDDYAELGLLKEDDGKYKLRMTNEVDETQMTNLTELWVVDHPAGTRVVPDTDGKPRTVSAPQESRPG